MVYKSIVEVRIDRDTLAKTIFIVNAYLITVSTLYIRLRPVPHCALRYFVYINYLPPVSLNKIGKPSPSQTSGPFSPLKQSIQRSKEQPKSNQIWNDSTNDLCFSKSQKRNHNKKPCPVISEVHLNIMAEVNQTLFFLAKLG